MHTLIHMCTYMELCMMDTVQYLVYCVIVRVYVSACVYVRVCRYTLFVYGYA